MSKQSNKKKGKKTTGKSLTVEARKPRSGFIWIIPIVTIIVFSPLFNQEFINYDDDWMIYENRYTSELSLQNAGELFSEFYMGQYSPASMSVIGLVNAAGNGNVKWFKIVGLLMHIANSFLVYLLFRNMLADKRVALIAMAFFALHPVQVESVAWLSAAFKVVIFAFFTLLSLLMWERFTKRHSPLFYLAALLFMVLACFAKEQALVIPLFMMIISWYRRTRMLSLKTVLQYLPFIATSAIFVVVSYLAVTSRAEVQLVQYSLPERIYYLSYSFILYFKLLVFPANLAIFYGIPELSTLSLIAFPVLTISGIWLIYRFSKKDNRVLWAVLFFIISLILTFALQLVSIREILYADRYLYLGVPAFFTMLYIILQRYNWSRVQLLFIGLLVIFSGMSYARVQKFDNSETIWTDAIEKGFKTPLAYNNRGHYYRMQNQMNLALRDYEEALKLNPRYFRTLNNRGKILFDQGKVDLAMEDFNRSLEIAPDFPSALSNRGAAYAAKGAMDLAIADLNRAIELDPMDKNAYSNRALALYYMGRFPEVVDDVNIYLKLSPNDADMLNLRALAYRQDQQNDNALTDLNAAIAINPQQGAFFQNRSFLYFALGDTTAALNDIIKAQQLGLQIDQNYLSRLTRSK